MEPTEVKAAVDTLGHAFEEFKKANDERLTELKKNSVSRPETETKVVAINAEINKLGDELRAVGKKQADDTAIITARLARLNAGGGEGETKAAAELKAFNIALKSHAAQFARVAHEVDAESYALYKRTFDAWLRKGQPEMLPELERKALSVGSDPDGGYLVTPDMTGQIATKIFESSPIRSIAAVQAISTESLEGIADNDEAGAAWIGETGARTATTSPTLDKWIIPVHEHYAMPEATQKLLDDAAINVEAWLAGKVADKLARLEATAFVNGTGVAQPRGFLTYAAGTTWGQIEQVNSGTSAAFTADGLITLAYTLKSAHRTGSVFVLSRLGVAAVRKLKGSDNNYLWQPGLGGGVPATLLGYPVVEAEDMPALAANSLSGAFGNFRTAYQIVDRAGVRVLRDPFTNKPYIRFYTTRRVGGAVVHFEAIKIQKLAV